MDLAQLIYNAARDGQVVLLMVYAVHHSPQEIEAAVGTPHDGLTPLAIACINGHLEVVEYLVDRMSALVDQTCSTDEMPDATPLWFAASKGHQHVMRSLFSRRANPNHEVLGFSLLFMAATNDDREMARLLLDHGADINLATSPGQVTPLMEACLNGHMNMAVLLMQRLAAVDRLDSEDRTALSYAAMNSHFFCLRQLISYGANIHPICNEFTPLLMVRRTANSPSVTYDILFPFCTELPLGNDLDSLGASHNVTFMASRYDWPYQRMNVMWDGQLGRYDVRDEGREYLGGVADRDRRCTLRVGAIRITIAGLSQPISETLCHYNVRDNHNDNHDYGVTEIENMWLLSVEMQRSAWVSDETLIERSVSYFVELFFMLAETDRPLPNQVMLIVFILSVGAIERYMRNLRGGEPSAEFEMTLSSVLTLIFILEHQRPSMPPEHDALLDSTVGRLVRCHPRDGYNRTLLHILCSEPQPDFIQPHHLDVMCLLVSGGADPRAVDMDGDTPLHILARQLPVSHQHLRHLLENGADLRIQNALNHRFIDYIRPPAERGQYQQFELGVNGGVNGGGNDDMIGGGNGDMNGGVNGGGNGGENGHF